MTYWVRTPLIQVAPWESHDAGFVVPEIRIGWEIREDALLLVAAGGLEAIVPALEQSGLPMPAVWYGGQTAVTQSNTQQPRFARSLSVWADRTDEVLVVNHGILIGRHGDLCRSTALSAGCPCRPTERRSPRDAQPMCSAGYLNKS